MTAGLYALYDYGVSPGAFHTQSLLEISHRGYVHHPCRFFRIGQGKWISETGAQYRHFFLQSNPEMVWKPWRYRDQVYAKHAVGGFL